MKLFLCTLSILISFKLMAMPEKCSKSFYNEYRYQSGRNSATKILNELWTKRPSCTDLDLLFQDMELALLDFVEFGLGRGVAKLCAVTGIFDGQKDFFNFIKTKCSLKCLSEGEILGRQFAKLACSNDKKLLNRPFFAQKAGICEDKSSECHLMIKEHCPILIAQQNYCKS